MFLGIANAISGIKSGGLSFIKDNLKLYLDFKSNKSDTLKFPSEGSTEFGNSKYVEFGEISFTDFSISAWVYMDDLSTQTILGDGNNNNWVRIDGANSIKLKAGGTSTTFSPSLTFTTGEWQHICITRESNLTKVYRNGAVGTGTANNTGTFAPDRIGAKIGNTSYFHGKMANVAVWSRALSPEEVQSIMNKSYSQLKGVEKTSLVSWWALDSATTGSNLIADSGFDDANYWIAGSGWSVNGTTPSKAVGADTWSKLQVGSLLKDGVTYRFTADVRRLSGIGLFRFYAQSNFGANIYPYAVNGDNLATYTQDLVSNSDNGNPAIRIGGSALSIEVDNFTVQELNIHKDSHGSNDGSNVGATINSNVYGGNAPILPRAVDVAKEGQADAIGDGSASFNGSSDYVDVGSDSLLDNIWTGGGTLSAWIYPRSDGEGNFGMIAVKRNGNTSGWYLSTVNEFLGVCGLRLRSARDTADGGWTTTSREITLNEWNHIAVSYNSDSDSNNALIYVNGINVAVTRTDTPSGSHSSDASDVFKIGGEAGAFTYDGSISQLGIWKGELTQAQIQSVMESTSYSKIPTDVKSTLGSELFTSVGNTTGWSYDSSAETLTASSTSATAYTNVLSGVSEGDLVKLSFDVTGHTGGSVYISCGGGSQNTSNFTNGSHTIYLVSGSGSQKIAFDGGTPYSAVLSNISVKEVTNDIVAYYPLDGSSSANGVTQDVTTGETLGSEVNTLANATSPTNETDATTGLTSTGSIDFVSSQTYSSNYSLKFETTENGQSVYASSNFTVEVGKLYKFSVTWKTESNDHSMKHFIGTTAGSTAYVGIEGVAGSTDWVTSDYYFVTTHTILNFMFAEFTGDSDIVMYIDNISIKKVTSNTGVLK